ncbi:MAG TPA: protein-disulfide reductase DsbD domain-containing protein, partial [Candidatus Saccharimonadales bacterium]|nr:protein-disulfide reductase DsbD domain-containing protein [Candidatus Saccharimonadales bacterium]
PGSRVTVAVEIELPRDVHLYAPGVKGYKQVELVLEPSTDFKASALQFPASKILFLKAINERVPVFTGKFRISQDVTVAASREFSASVGKGKEIAIKGELRYQACDDKVCYNPVTTPVTWNLQVAPLDLQRAPEGVRHK